MTNLLRRGARRSPSTSPGPVATERSPDDSIRGSASSSASNHLLHRLLRGDPDRGPQPVSFLARVRLLHRHGVGAPSAEELLRRLPRPSGRPALLPRPGVLGRSLEVLPRGRAFGILPEGHTLARWADPPPDASVAWLCPDTPGPRPWSGSSAPTITQPFEAEAPHVVGRVA